MNEGCPYILLDTNVLAERTRILRTGLGPTLIYFAKIRSAKFLLPEVINIELRRYAIAEVGKLNHQLLNTTRQVREWAGEATDPYLPSPEEVRRTVDERLRHLSRWLEHRPSDPDLIIRAAQRVFQKVAPSHRDGEDAFKDCLIWETLLSLPRGASVDFVSDDARAFYDPNDPNSLHPDLRREAMAAGLSLDAHRGLASLVRKLQGSVPDVDHDRAAVALNAVLAEHFITAMQRWNLDGLTDEVFDLQPFVTEEPGILYLEFSVRARGTGKAAADGATYESPLIQLQGSCRYDPHGPVRDVRLTQVSLHTVDGRELQATKFGYVQASESGRRPFQLKRSLRDIDEQGAESIGRGRRK